MPAHEPLPSRTAADIVRRREDVFAAERALARARNRLDSALYRAVVTEGCQVAAVAEVAGLSRETVYKATGRA